jgi:hypothetical protein
MVQPLLHDLVSCVRAPALVLSSPDGQLRRGGVQGWFRGDRRLLDRLEVRLGGTEPEPLRSYGVGSTRAVFTSVARHLGDSSTDPTVRLDRERELSDRQLVETITVTSASQSDVDVDLAVVATSDLAGMTAVRSGEPPAPVPAVAEGSGLSWCAPETGEVSVVLRCEPPPDASDGDTGTLRWRRRLGTAETLRIRLVGEVRDQPADFVAPDAPPWHLPEILAGDVRMPLLVRQSLDDLDGLLLLDRASGDAFLAAGTPWYLTLFGRDSLWAARMMLPTGTGLAMSTLRTLAQRQGSRDDPETEEEPGKIPHEVRAERQVLGGMSLPPLYYGTVDATALFVVLLGEAWRWGADPAEVRRLLPHAQACLRWVERAAGDGFIRYVDRSGHGLANQGWKDSEDGVQWADGALAEPPIALSEVQAYAYQAATAGADLLDAFGEPGAGHWREWAAGLAARFRDHFWVEDRIGPYPAVALDRRGRPVDSVASNMGHLLGTGLLDPREAALVAGRLAGADMDSGFGLRTLTSASPRYSPLSYHGGSVWPHDTAIAVHGLCREGHGQQAGRLLRGLLDAAPWFGYRLPELYAGDPASRFRAPAPYPSACRPQAWSAAAPLWGLVSLLGLDVDVPAGSVRVARSVDAGLGELSVRDLRVGGHRLDIRLEADGRVSATTDHPRLEVRTRQ